MRVTHAKATLFALGLASWSIPFAAFAVGEPAGVATNAVAPPALRHDVALAAGDTSSAGRGDWPSATSASWALPATKEKVPQNFSTNRVLALASVVPLSDDELESARGGFSVGGINFNFGASVQTLVNGQLALQTNVQWTSAGAVVTQLQGLGTSIQNQVASTLADAGINVPTTSSPAQATGSTIPGSPAASNVPSTVGNSGSASPSALSPPASTTTVPASFVNISPTTSGGSPTPSPVSYLIGLSALQSSPGNTAASPNAQPLTANSLVATVATAPSNNGDPSASGAPNIPSPGNSVAPASNSSAASVNNPTVMSGVQIKSQTGTTDVFANVANGQIQSLILNSASNQSIVQNTNIVLTIYNLASLQQLAAQHAMSMQLTNQLLAASGFGGGR
jgi:hypothetical protein